MNPRRACARVTVVVLCVCVCVCVCVYLSVPTLAASASVETSKRRYSRVSLRLLIGGFSKKPFVRKFMACKSQYANELELTACRFRALSGPAKRRECLKDDWQVQYCFRD